MQNMFTPFQDLQMSHPKLWHQAQIQELKSSVSGPDVAEAPLVEFISPETCELNDKLYPPPPLLPNMHTHTHTTQW